MKKRKFPEDSIFTHAECLTPRYMALWAFVPLVFILSCSNHSVFAGLDKPDTELISKYKGERLLSSLELNTGSKVFYETLTSAQMDRILGTLDSIIAGKKGGSGDSAVMVSRAALAAVDVLVHTNELTYAIIYNLTDPALVAITDSGASPSVIFGSYTRPLESVADDSAAAEKVIAECFYNLYRITSYYDIAALSSRYGSYSGGDLQKYVVSGLVSSVLSGTVAALKSSVASVQNLSTDVAQAYLEVVKQTSTELETILTGIFNELRTQLGAAGADIAAAYREQLLDRADILEDIALYAGFQTVAKAAAAVLREWGGENG